MYNNLPIPEETVFYVPGHKESFGKNQPGMAVKELAEKAGKHYERMILPGDTRYDNHSEYSLSATRERVRELLQSIPDNTLVVTYSLSSLPVLGAVADSGEDVRKKISKIVFLHPADNPAYSVSVVDWALGRGKSEVKPIEHYLRGDPSLVFNRLNEGWRGDGMQFQQDLIETSQEQIDIAAILSSLDIDHSIIDSNEDAVTRRRVMQDGDMKFTEVLRSHIPDLSHQRFIN